MRSALRILIIALALSAFSFADEKPITVSLDELQKDKAKFDGKAIRVRGEAVSFRQKTSKAGNKYFTFTLKDGEPSVNVYGRGELTKALKEGAKVEVTGVYRVQKIVTGVTFKNEIDCTAVEGKPYGIKEVD